MASAPSTSRGPMVVIVGDKKNKYQVLNKIGAGSFGEIYVGRSVATNEKVAIKLEKSNHRYPQLLNEKNHYRSLEGGVGIPRFHWFGYAYNHNILVIDKLGCSLEDLFNKCSRKFTLKTVLMLADQMLKRIEYIHSKNIIHRDIKPDNFLMGGSNRINQVFLIDFGLAKKFRDDQTQEHIPYREDKNMTGTARYVSVNAHNGLEQSRRDDIESLGYVLLYFYKGSLPWQGLKATCKKQKYERIHEKKMSTPVEEVLCQGLPAEFVLYIRYCRQLLFEEAPDYLYLRRLFSILFFTMKFDYDYTFDWWKPTKSKEVTNIPAPIPTPIMGPPAPAIPVP